MTQRVPQKSETKQLIEAEYARRLSGQQGENALNYPLSFLPEKDFSILQGLRLPSKYGYFQMDTLVLINSFALIVEAKNFSGTLYFDQEFHQLIRKIAEKEESFEDPIIQVERQKLQLKHWLESNTNSPLPIETLVVISKPSTIIKASNLNVSKKVCHANVLPEKIKYMMKIHTREQIEIKDRKKIVRKLLKANTPLELNILKNYHLKKEEIVTGVSCPKCRNIPMKRRKGNWECTSCGHISKSAHIQAINDYFLLLAPTITNKEFRQFTHLQSRKTAYKLLMEMKLPYSGDKKSRTYFQK
ncbi:NERD domain-containing protein [Bacillaceae bacterium Marseille-Q3522]|nr:NERD domain-containing protein [Bacillaceae bacterium Marseille-Q3522]